MTIDWRIYEMLTKEDWRPGDEPSIHAAIIIKQGDHDIRIPIPRGATASVVNYYECDSCNRRVPSGDLRSLSGRQSDGTEVDIEICGRCRGEE